VEARPELAMRQGCGDHARQERKQHGSINNRPAYATGLSAFVLHVSSLHDVRAGFLLDEVDQAPIFAMFTPPKNTLRRMKLEELIAKMQQIEEQVSLTLHEYPRGHTVERQRLVLAIARQVRAHLMDQAKAGEREAIPRDTETHLRVVNGDERAVRIAVLPDGSAGAPEK